MRVRGSWVAWSSLFYTEDYLLCPVSFSFLRGRCASKAVEAPGSSANEKPAFRAAWALLFSSAAPPSHHYMSRLLCINKSIHHHHHRPELQLQLLRVESRQFNSSRLTLLARGSEHDRGVTIIKHLSRSLGCCVFTVVGGVGSCLFGARSGSRHQTCGTLRCARKRPVISQVAS